MDIPFDLETTIKRKEDKYGELERAIENARTYYVHP